ncbi:angiopoietin-2-like isoform X1 [Lethenteron reissneri]|uniref:angiopoietin-2-like isoform X1 n=1 Tax=Lethenteron reissneri TaxID=7753 RepID=UPI002AB6077B|nr:angiopoietin-2-like isoform X1 [Lethenteron reissneri]
MLATRMMDALVLLCCALRPGAGIAGYWLGHRVAVAAAAAVAVGGDTAGRAHHRIQHGPCTYTFLLPELAEHHQQQQQPQQQQPQQGCTSGAESLVTNSLQRDAPNAETDRSQQRLQQLEVATENNTQWLVKLQNSIREGVMVELAQLQQRSMNNQTTAMLEASSNLLMHTAGQTRRLATIEAQVLNHTSRLEIQLLENSLSTSKLEKQLLQQAQDISRIQEKNVLLERRLAEQEGRLAGAHQERRRVQELLSGQGARLAELARRLDEAGAGHGRLLRQHAQLASALQETLARLTQDDARFPFRDKEEKNIFRDCGEFIKSGHTNSGVYVIYPANDTVPAKVYCDMETDGGGWTVIQRREDGSVDFHRSWQDYTTGFGEATGEHWLGNEIIHQLCSQKTHQMRITLKDWEGNTAFSTYERFSIASEKQNYRLHARGYGGTAGKHSSLGQGSSSFSTRDADNDNCPCRCAQMSTGGWWFDACGPSNLNGMYYSAGQNVGRFNGIKWHYWKGSSYSLRATTIMIRPIDI